jgi:hypothetical protein
MTNKLLPLILLLLLTVVAGCSEQEEPVVALDEANLTVEEIYARFAEAITRPGSVYQVTADMDYDGGYYLMDATRRLWVDVAGDRVRDEGNGEMRAKEEEEETTEGEGPMRYEWKTITTGGATYGHQEQPQDESEPDSKHEARTCHGGNAAVSTVLGCPGWTEDSIKSAEIGEYKGRAAVVLVTTGTSHGEDETTTFTERLYLDRRTLLPIAAEYEGTLDYGEIYAVYGLTTFKSRFVSADSLPGHFFDPASIGYVEHDPEEPLQSDLGITVYWLGKRFESGGGLPPLALKEAWVTDPEKGPGYLLTLEYRPADDEFASAAVTVEEWDIDRWNASHTGIVWPDPNGPPVTVGNWWERPCWERREVELPAGHGTIILAFENDTEDMQPTTAAGERVCPSSPHDRFMALAYLGSTVLQIDAPGILSGDGYQENPFDTLEGMEAVLNGLQSRQ